jgi:hypothetical protein
LQKSISTLEGEIARLENSSVPWEYSLLVFTLLVVIGVVLELVVIRHDWRDDMQTWALGHFGISREPARPSRTKLWVEVISVLLITLGVAGELGVGIVITVKNGEIRTKNGELRTKSGQLVSVLNQRSSELDQEASALRLENTHLEAIVQPRTINLEERKSLASTLLKFAPSLKGKNVEIGSLSGDAEASIAALEINDVLNRAGIGTDSSGIGRLQWVGPPSTGMEITGDSKDDAFIKAVARGVNSSTKTDVLSKWGPKCPELRVLVWPKPIPGIPQIKPATNSCAQ